MENVRVEFAPPLAWIIVDRPKALNALNGQTLSEIAEACAQVAARDDVRCALFTGAGEKAFIAGADIAEMRSIGEPAARVFSEVGHRAADALAGLDIPIVAVVNGFALGGGLEMALACDFMIAGEKAVFGQPEVDLGVTPGFGGTQRLARKIGVARATELILTGRKVKADEAKAIGLVVHVFAQDTLKSEAETMAKTIAAKGPIAVRLAKKAIREGLDTTLAQGNQLEMTAFAKCFATADQKEGMTAFLEKRAAVFTGK